MSPPTVLERAFTLARTGKYRGMGEIRDQLLVEGYNTYQLTGPALQRQLLRLCVDARKVAEL